MTENLIELSGIFSEGYGFVPKKLMRAKDLSSTTKMVLCYLLSFTGAGVSCFPQIKDIAADLNITTRTVIRSINQSVKQGYIRKHQENRGGKIGTKNTYEILFMYNFGKKLPQKEGDNDGDKNVTHTPQRVTPEHLEGDIRDQQRVTPGQSNNNNIKVTIKSNNIGDPEGSPKVNHVFNLITVFSELYEKRYGVKFPTPTTKKNFGIINNLIKNGQTPEDIEARMRAAFASNNLYFMKDSALDLGAFSSNYAKIPLNVKPIPQNPVDYRADLKRRAAELTRQQRQSLGIVDTEATHD